MIGEINVTELRRNFPGFIQNYINSDVVGVDIWFLRLKCDYEKGDVIEVEKNSDTFFLKSLGEKENSLRYELKRHFINYFSMGYDARVGFGNIYAI